jgi:ribosomal protein S18 acetylase RimI-like enzyme
MERDLAGEIPAPVFPQGYEFRHIPREQGQLWESVMDQAFGNYQAGDFEFVMVQNYGYLPERVYILFDELDQSCATASAWSQPYLWGEEYGFVIFVGVIPALRNQGLAKQMLFSICDTIKKRGQRFALLNVDSKNLAAVKCYLNAGFLPRLISRKQARVWKSILKKLNMKNVSYPGEILRRMDNPHPARPWLLDLREQGYEVR